MFDRSDLEDLAAFSGEHPVVSLYLNLPPHLRRTPEAYRARLKGLLKEIEGRAPADDIEAIESYFEKEFDWLGRSVVVFSGSGDGLWLAHSFAVPMRSTVHVRSKPFLMPLVNAMDTYGSYSVALVDQRSIRMHYFHLGEQVASEKLEGEEIKRLKSGGGAPGRARGDDLSGYTQETVRGNLKGFADALVLFCKRHKAEHILLGGSEPTLHLFKSFLSQPWQDRVEGMFTVSMHASDSEVLAESLRVMQAKEEAREAALVEHVRTLAAKGAAGVVGLKETQAAIDAGRVQTLLLVEGAVPPEVADPAIVKVVDHGGEVEFISNGSPLAAEGGIAALLRY